jgi:folate-dependent phosphoribosylglycinamide formyltransferase PurN
MVQTADVNYMEGVIERTVRESLPGGALDGIAEVVGVITDDLLKDMISSDFPPAPTAGKPWIHSMELMGPDGVRIVDLTFNIASEFRSLPLNDVKGRVELKREFERKIKELMIQLKADVLVSDHYMARIEWLIGIEGGLYGRVLNIHPAITLANHPFCFRGMTPTADAIRAAQSSEVFTGATLHVVNATIDDGPQIAYAAITPVHAGDEAQWLRYRNYQQAKLPVFVAGLLHYINSLYPALAGETIEPRQETVAV